MFWDLMFWKDWWDVNNIWLKKYLLFVYARALCTVSLHCEVNHEDNAAHLRFTGSKPDFFFLRTMSLHWFLSNYYALVVLVVIFSYTNLYG